MSLRFDTPWVVTLLSPMLLFNRAIDLRAADTPHNNVIIIYADDLGWGDLGCYGHSDFKTPNIDRMARRGARLTNFYSSCPYCAPSRASLLTGRYPFRCGITRNPAPDGPDPTRNDVGIPDDELLLGEVFQAAGYRTACYGKWHLGHQPKFYPVRHGFDEYLGILYSNDMRPVELFENETRIEYPVQQSTLTKRYTRRSLKFIDTNSDRPFFLYLAHAMPHKPLAASDAFYKQTGTGLYGDVIAELDWSVGQILDKLKQHDLEQKTLVFFTSDNGPWYGGSTGGLRGMKAQCWEGGLRVPLIAYLPGVIPRGHVNHEPAIIMDLFTTSLKAAGIDRPADRQLDGKDIMPLLCSNAKSPHTALFSIHGKPRTIRSGRWKLHAGPTPPPDRRTADWIDPRAPDGKTILAPQEQYGPTAFPGVKSGDTSRAAALFDLESDPAEQHNVADEHPDVVQRLLAEFRKMRTEFDRSTAQRSQAQKAQQGR